MDKTVFVVDDVGINLSVTKAVLDDKYKVVTMSSGKKVFVLLEKIMAQLILLDIDMPEMSGFDVIKALKADERYVNIPVIFLTGMMDAETEKEGFAMGAVDFITKPFDPLDLLEKVERHMI